MRCFGGDLLFSYLWHVLERQFVFVRDVRPFAFVRFVVVAVVYLLQFVHFVRVEAIARGKFVRHPPRFSKANGH